MRITREGWCALPKLTRREIGRLATQPSPFINEGREAQTEQVIKRNFWWVLFHRAVLKAGQKDAGNFGGSDRAHLGLEFRCGLAKQLGNWQRCSRTPWRVACACACVLGAVNEREHSSELLCSAERLSYLRWLVRNTEPGGSFLHDCGIQDRMPGQLPACVSGTQQLKDHWDTWTVC